jgi:hypothetical protein
LKNLHIDRANVSRPEGFVACASFARLLESVAVETGDATFGLRFGARSNPKNIGALAYAVFNSPTVKAAFETAGRYIHLHNEAAEVAFSEANDLSYFVYRVKNLDFDEPRQFVDTAWQLPSIRSVSWSAANGAHVRFISRMTRRPQPRSMCNSSGRR